MGLPQANQILGQNKLIGFTSVVTGLSHSLKVLNLLIKLIGNDKDSDTITNYKYKKRVGGDFEIKQQIKKYKESLMTVHVCVPQLSNN